MDHVSVVVDDLATAIAFFAALGMTVESEMPVEGPTETRDRLLPVLLSLRETGETVGEKVRPQRDSNLISAERCADLQKSIESFGSVAVV